MYTSLPPFALALLFHASAAGPELPCMSSPHIQVGACACALPCRMAVLSSSHAPSGMCIRRCEGMPAKQEVSKKTALLSDAKCEIRREQSASMRVEYSGYHMEHPAIQKEHPAKTEIALMAGGLSAQSAGRTCDMAAGQCACTTQTARLSEQLCRRAGPAQRLTARPGGRPAARSSAARPAGPGAAGSSASLQGLQGGQSTGLPEGGEHAFPIERIVNQCGPCTADRSDARATQQGG